MAYYYIILSMFIMLAYFYDYRKLTLMRGFWLVMMWLILVCVAGFRYHVGFDSRYYEYEYPDMPTLLTLADYDFSDTRYQPLYIVFTAIARTISKEFMCLQLLHALCLNTVIFWFFSKFTRHTFVALSLYFLMLFIPFNFEVLRESLAVSLFLLAWPYFLKQKWIKYYILVFIAFGFHISAAATFLLPLLWCTKIRHILMYGRRTIVLCAILAGVGLIVYQNFFEILKGLSFLSMFSERIDLYSGNDMGGMALNVNGVIVNLTRDAVYPLLAIYFLQKRLKYREVGQEERDTLLKEEMVSMCGVYIVVLSIFIFILTRYNNYFLPVSILLVSDFVYSSVPKKRKNVRLNAFIWWMIFLPLFFMQAYNVTFTKLNPPRYTIGMIYSYNSQFNPQNKKEVEEAYRSQQWFRLKR